MTTFGKFLEFLHKRAENLLALILASLFFSFLIQIVFRYFLNWPVGWTVEYVAIAWLWGILFGYAFVIREDEIIRFDIVYGMLPAAMKRLLDAVTSFICGAIFLWTLPAVWDFVTFMAVEKTAYMQIRFDYVFAIYIPFMISVIIRCLINLAQAIKGTHPKYALHAGAESHLYD